MRDCCSILCAVNEPQMTRDQLTYTSTLAELGGVTGGKVVPYVALGAGWFRNSSAPHTEHICDEVFPLPNPSPGWGRRRQLQPSKGNSMVSPQYAGFSLEFDYSLDYSALLGAQVNLKRFEHSVFGPWERVPAAIFYPSPLRSPPAADGRAADGNASTDAFGLSTVALEHLIAYIKGGTGVQ